MQQCCDPFDVGAHAGDVGRGRERADALAAPVARVVEQLLEMLEVDVARRIQAHLHGRDQGLAPRYLVGVVLVRSDEYHRLVCLQRLVELPAIAAGNVAVDDALDILARSRRQRDADDLLQLVDGPGGAGAAGDDPAVRSRVHRRLDRRFGLVQQLAHAAARDVVFRMRIGVDALQALQVGLDKAQAAARRRVVAVNHQPFAERRVEGRVDPDDLLPQELRSQRRVSHLEPVRDLELQLVHRQLDHLRRHEVGTRIEQARPGD